MLAKIKLWANQLKRQARILQLVYQDVRTPLKAKVIIWVTLGYLFSPIDLIPDFIPILGLLDDIIIVPLLISITIRMVPKNVWADAVENVNNQQLQKWRLNWIVILIICLAWLASAYFVYRLAHKYFN